MEDNIVYINSYFPQIFIFGKKIYYYWIMFYLSLAVILALVLFSIRYNDFSNFFYISKARKLELRTYQILVRVFPLALFSVLLLPWAICLKYSIWITTVIMLTILVLAVSILKLKFNRTFTRLIPSIETAFVMPYENLFSEKNVFFRDILYNTDGLKKYFLARTLLGKWVIINKRLKVYGRHKFDDFIEEKEGVFIMEADEDKYYVYINGEKPRINQRVA